MWSTSRSEAALEAALPAPIRIRQLKSARRLRLRFDEASGTLKLTCPCRTSRRAALAATRGNQIRAAELLGVNRNTLRKKVRDLDLQVFRTAR